MLHPQHAEIRLALMEKRTVLVRSIYQLHQKLPSLASAEQPTNNIRRELHARVRELNHVVEALDAIQYRDYGVCVTCHLPIPVPELLGNPAQRRCSSCVNTQSEDTRTATP